MVVPRSSAQTWTAAFTGRYDDEEIEWLAGLVTSGSLVLDVGACFGFYTVPLAMAAARVGARVVAFEPVPANVSVLRRNVTENGLAQLVDIMPFGLAREGKNVKVRVEGLGFGNAAVLAGEVELDNFAATDVRLERLDDARLPAPCNGKRCSLVKMDVEGFEMEVLAGGEDFVRRHRPAIYGEFNEWFLERYGLGRDAPLRWAETNEYLCYYVRRRRRHVASDRYAIRLVETEGTTRIPGYSLFLLPSEALAATTMRGGING